MTESEESLSGQTPCEKLKIAQEFPRAFFLLFFFFLHLLVWRRFHFTLNKCFLLPRFEVNETIGVLTLVAYRNKGTYGNVSLLLFAQSLEAQQGLDYNASETVRRWLCTHLNATKHILTKVKVGLEFKWGQVIADSAPLALYSYWM